MPNSRIKHNAYNGRYTYVRYLIVSHSWSFYYGFGSKIGIKNLMIVAIKFQNMKKKKKHLDLNTKCFKTNYNFFYFSKSYN